ncbi:4-oxalocrotonate decarboxylase [Pandoraea terrae]|uniref:4-oxalocrotonate decarboxylase n=1 Tax=Pandoraea terrae TaxID=1537710 RepID=A0A5E4XHP4_9BURK|nr:fumarylacetoacetate hydrolase family protein [Pandoraea terrae]VVE35807.1 4-oxalocrotonate decarboxylase [Pandoraea terrae]
MSGALNTTQVEAIAARLDDAARNANAVAQTTLETPFSLDEAYRIQRASMARRYLRGEQPVGIKLGFTSRAKMIQMGVHALIWGWLTDAMREEDGGHVALDRFIHPRAEPEVCFVTRRVIDRPLTALEAVDYLEAVAPAVEIIDSRYRDFKFTLEDVVADNCSSAGFVVGAFSRDFDALANTGVQLRIDGRPVETGSTAAILGHPLRALVQASQQLHAAGFSLPAGSLIFAGAATAAVALAPGMHVSAELGRLGRAEFATAAAQGVVSA